MGGYILESGQKLQTDEYIEHLEEQQTKLGEALDAALAYIKELDKQLDAYRPRKSALREKP